MVETVSASERRFIVSIAADEVLKIRQSHIRSLANSTPINGFRKGSAAAERFIVQRYQDTLEENIRKDLLESSFNDLLKIENNLQPVSEPIFSEIKVEMGTSLSYIVSFEIYPPAPTPELTGVTLEKLEVNITETDIDQALSLFNHSAKEASTITPELRTKVRQWMASMTQQIQRNKLIQKVKEHLVTNYPIQDLPKRLTEQHYQRLLAEARAAAEDKSNSTENQQQDEDSLRATARRQVTLDMLFNAYITTHNIQLETTRVNAKILEIAGGLQGDRAMLKRLTEDRRILSMICSQVMEEQVIDKILEQVNYQIKSSNYTETIGFPMAKTVDQEDATHE